MAVQFVVVAVHIKVINYFASRYPKFETSLKRRDDFDGQFT
jgi:hypothetical protein